MVSGPGLIGLVVLLVVIIAIAGVVVISTTGIKSTATGSSSIPASKNTSTSTTIISPVSGGAYLSFAGCTANINGTSNTNIASCTTTLNSTPNFLICMGAVGSAYAMNGVNWINDTTDANSTSIGHITNGGDTCSFGSKRTSSLVVGLAINTSATNYTFFGSVAKNLSFTVSTPRAFVVLAAACSDGVSCGISTPANCTGSNYVPDNSLSAAVFTCNYTAGKYTFNFSSNRYYSSIYRTLGAYVFPYNSMNQSNPAKKKTTSTTTSTTSSTTTSSTTSTSTSTISPSNGMYTLIFNATANGMRVTGTNAWIFRISVANGINYTNYTASQLPAVFTVPYNTPVGFIGSGNLPPSNSSQYIFVNITECGKGSSLFSRFNVTSNCTVEIYFNKQTINSTSFWSATTPFPEKIGSESCTTYNNDMYCVGGINASKAGGFGNIANAVYYAPMSSSGLGNWTRVGVDYPNPITYSDCVTTLWSGVTCVGGYTGTTISNEVSRLILGHASGNIVIATQWANETPFPLYADYHSCVTSPGWVSNDIYCMGGYTGYTISNSMYFIDTAASNAVWTKSTNSYPISVIDQSCVSNAYDVYCIGGEYLNYTTTNASYYAPIGFGGIGAWQQTTSYPTTSIDLQSCVENGGYIYCVGGNGGAGNLNLTYKAPISNSGIGAWQWVPNYPQRFAAGSCVTNSTYMYCVGGTGTSALSNNTWFAKI